MMGMCARKRVFQQLYSATKIEIDAGTRQLEPWMR